MDSLPEARILVTVALDPGSAVKGTRIVGLDTDGTAHVFTQRGDENAIAAEQSINRTGAMLLALAVLAGKERACTAPDTLKLLAAAVVLLADGSAPDGEPASAELGPVLDLDSGAAEVVPAERFDRELEVHGL